MVAYSFQARFMPAIVEKTKRQTIRKPRKGQAKVGSELQLYFGMRTKFCRLIGTATCVEIHPIGIDIPGDFIWFRDTLRGFATRYELNQFAIHDGFEGWRQLQQFWMEFHPDTTTFLGDLIVWGDTFAPTAPV